MHHFIKELFPWIAVILISSAIIFAMFFSRVIDRIIPVEGIVSPASGKIISIFTTSEPDIVFEKEGVTNHVTIPEITGPVHVILIELNLGDVHVQRAPIAGKIVRMDHYNGKHANALGKNESTIVTSNEKVITIFENDTTRIGVVQVAGRAARRIVNKAKNGSWVTKGQVYGRIVLGSQVVVIIPESIPLSVTVGERMTDGVTILAENE
jgi:phosphatidylserine decarboxylase